jgi:5-methylcytosine-specific restriction enzyme A
MATRYPDRLQRPAWHRWYGLQRWRRMARQQLRAHPACQVCALDGITVPAEIVHHKTQHHGGEHAFWYGELESVCKACHDGRIQQTEKRGYETTIGVDGFPVDVNHPANVSERKMVEREQQQQQNNKKKK